MPESEDGEIKGLTLSVYLYVIKKNMPVGPRDVMKGAHLSSPSVAYRHLEKLEDLKLLQKNNYGEYVAVAKARVRGYIWVGRRLLPKMLVYSLVFMAILIVEISVLAVHFAVEDFRFFVFFALLTLITGSAMLMFAVEGLLQWRRTKLVTKTEQIDAFQKATIAMPKFMSCFSKICLKALKYD